jgi:hypothetical protein
MAVRFFLWSVSFGLLLAGGAAAGQTPVPVSHPPIEFKDLTPPELHGGGHGNGHGAHAGGGHEAAHSASHGAAHGHEEGGPYATATYLLMRPRRGLFDFAVRDPNRNLVPEGTLESLNYELRSGVRATLGYAVPHTAWDLAAGYTYFRSNADRTVFAPPGGTVYATLTRPGLNDEVTVARGSASLEYNVFDAVIGRTYHPDECTTLRAFGGLSWATIRQRFDADYDGADATIGRVTTRSNFNGFGPVAGLEGQFNVTPHWHVHARALGGLYTGSVRNPIRETNNAGLTTYADVTFGTRKVVPMASLALGGGWNSGRVTIRAGYELTNWFGLIDQPRLTGELSEGKLLTRSADLSLEGFYAHVGLTF